MNQQQLDDNQSMLSIPNNPLIAKSFYLRGTFENWGRGIGLIKRECLSAGLPTPIFLSKGGVVTVIFYFDQVLGRESLNNGGLNGGLDGGLNQSQRRTLEYITQHPNCTVISISSFTGLAKDTIDKHIRVLLKNNLIERRGGKKNGGYFVKEKG